MPTDSMLQTITSGLVSLQRQSPVHSCSNQVLYSSRGRAHVKLTYLTLFSLFSMKTSPQSCSHLDKLIRLSCHCSHCWSHTPICRLLKLIAICNDRYNFKILVDIIHIIKIGQTLDVEWLLDIKIGQYKDWLYIIKIDQTLDVGTQFPLSQVNSSLEQGLGLVGVGVGGFSFSRQRGLQFVMF